MMGKEKENPGFVAEAEGGQTEHCHNTHLIIIIVMIVMIMVI